MEERIPKYLSGDLGKRESLDLLNVIDKDEVLKDEFVKMQNLYAFTNLSKLSKNDSDGRRSLQGFHQKLKSKKRQKNIQLVLKYAAVFLIITVSTFFANKWFIEYSNSAEWNTLTVPAGQRAHLKLQDGTSVWLNSQSTLTYPARFSGKTRRVTVTGEAYFDVAKNANKHFIVSTQDIEMKVLGTQFNVYSYSGTGVIKTDLVEGSLIVYRKQSPETSVTLKPNEQIVVNNEEFFVQEIQRSDYFLWKDGIYTFENERLLDIIEKLQLYYDVKILVKDPQIFKMRYTGKFRQRDGIDEILRIIQKIQKFNIEKDLEANTITLTK